jgi:hypothetical protein
VGISAAGIGRLFRIEGKMNGAKCREILDENLLQRAQDLRLGRRFKVNPVKHAFDFLKTRLQSKTPTCNN